jgi:hypothetical protein
MSDAEIRARARAMVAAKIRACLLEPRFDVGAPTSLQTVSSVISPFSTFFAAVGAHALICAHLADCLRRRACVPRLVRVSSTPTAVRKIGDFLSNHRSLA